MKETLRRKFDPLETVFNLFRNQFDLIKHTGDFLFFFKKLYFRNCGRSRRHSADLKAEILIQLKRKRGPCHPRIAGPKNHS